jgi:anti-sigma factor RsiW
MVRNGTCRSTRRRMSARLDGDLPTHHARRFDRHIAGCRRCARVLTSFRSTVEDLHALGEEPAPLLRSVADDVLPRLEDPDIPGPGDAR